MELPVYIDGVREGTLTVEREGAFTVLRVRLRDVGRVVRLRLYGEREAVLGVPQPEDGCLCLTRRLSPSAMRAFPQRPEYAADAPLKRPEQEPTQTSQAKPNPDAGTELSPPARRHVLWQGGRPHYF